MNYMTDGRRLISASVDGTAKIWDTNNGQSIDTLQGVHDYKVYNVAVNDAMTQAVTVGGSDKKIVLWDLRNTRQPLMVNTDSQSSVISCDFSNDQESVITGNLGGRIGIIDLATREWRVDYDTLVLQPDLEIENYGYGVKSVRNHPAQGNVFEGADAGQGDPALAPARGKRAQSHWAAPCTSARVCARMWVGAVV